MAFFSSKNSRRITQLEVWASQLGFWRNDLPAMQACQAQLAHSVSQLQFAKYSAKSVYIQEGLSAVADLHATALQALAQDRAFSAQTLAKDALRLAIDVLYIGLDPSDGRLVSAMRHHLDGQRERHTAWASVEPENGVANAQLAQIQAECRQAPWYAEAGEWPKLGARADAVQFGALVHSALALAADAEDAVMEDVRNILRIEQGKAAEREATHRYRNARLASDAAYVELGSLYMFGNVLEGVAMGSGDKVAVTIANSALESLETLMDAHKRTIQAHQNDTNIYIKV